MFKNKGPEQLDEVPTAEHLEEKERREGWLATLLSARAVGSFFDREGSFYFGESPLHFSVACNDLDIFDLLLSYSSFANANAIFIPDSHGNNVFHLCVAHGLKLMYDHVRMRASGIIRQELLTVLELRGDGPYTPERLNDETLKPLKMPSVDCCGHLFDPRELSLSSEKLEDVGAHKGAITLMLDDRLNVSVCVRALVSSCFK